MSQFYANIQGGRGEATRAGSKSSGLWGHIRGWEVGATVDLLHIGGKDVVRVYATPGTNGPGARKLIAEFSALDDVVEISSTVV